MNSIVKAFEKIGTRVKFGDLSKRQTRFRRIRNASTGRDVSLIVDIEKDKQGEFYKIETDGSVDLHIMNIDKGLHHLLLFARDKYKANYRFLCGLDERGWFAAAVPGAVSNISDAMDSLKPKQVVAAQKNIKTEKKNRRKNDAFLRQGEWFFLPAPGISPPEELILKNEPIQRGPGNPHKVQEIFRTGGEVVYVCRKYPQGVSLDRYREIMKNPEAKRMGWHTMKVDMTVYGKGKVTHRDHQTIVLKGWYQILPNRETESWFIENLAFLD